MPTHSERTRSCWSFPHGALRGEWVSSKMNTAGVKAAKPVFTLCNQQWGGLSVTFRFAGVTRLFKGRMREQERRVGPRQPGKWKSTKGRSVWVQLGQLCRPQRLGDRGGPSRFQGNSFRSLNISGLQEVHVYVSQRDRGRIHNHKPFYFILFF